MKVVSRATVFALALLASIAGPGAAAIAKAAAVPWKVDSATALRLASQGNFESDTGLQWFDPERYDGGPFFEFYGISKPPAEGSFGYFAVNRWTGDVWALWGCHKLSTPALRKSQAEIRRRFTRDELKHYARLSRLKPDCIVED
ncbi:MAG: hypothetical protein ACREFL_04285 [Stellaceae bacterium]